MKSEVMLDFCFISKNVSQMKQEVEKMFHSLFKMHRVHWYLEEKVEEDYKMIVAEIRGIGNFGSEDEVCTHIENNAEDDFWHWLQGYRFQVFPVNKGCACHANR